MVKELIIEMNDVLNHIKDFETTYSSKSYGDGYMLIEYKGKRYAVKAVEIANPRENILEDIADIKYFV